MFELALGAIVVSRTHPFEESSRHRFNLKFEENVSLALSMFNRLRKHFLSTPARSSVSVSTGELEFYGSKRQNKVTLRNLLDTGSGKTLGKGSPILENCSLAENINIQVASFLHRELPIRLAHRALALESIDIFRRSLHVSEVASWYKKSFQQLIDCPAPKDVKTEQLFAKTISDIYERHSGTLLMMAKGAYEIKQILGYDTITFAEQDLLQHKFEDFYSSRIGIRMMIGQYLSLRDESNTDPNMIGLISLRCSPYDIAQEAIHDANYICTRTHGEAPKVEIKGPDLHFPYVPTHIKYIFVELLKNSMRATIEKHGTDHPPPIKIIISDGEKNEDIVFKISDEGGGIKRSNMRRIWSYLFTTADPSVLDSM